MSSDADQSNKRPGITRRKFVGGVGAVAAASTIAQSEGALAAQAPSAKGHAAQQPLAAPAYSRAYPRGQGFHAVTANFFEAPMGDPEYLEVWCYTDKLSYLPGEEVQFHISTTASQFSIELIRDGHIPLSIHKAAGLTGEMAALPDDFHTMGCNWPVAFRWALPADLLTGFYLVISRAENERGEVREQEHGFFVKPARGGHKSDILLVAATSTWHAYNDWGGSNHYIAANPLEGFNFEPILTHHHRPFGRGQIALPEGAPRKPHEFEHGHDAIPRYPCIEFATTMGYSRWYPNAGWATYERPFVVWAEENGYALDYATQQDLHYDRRLLDDYKCVVFVGHDEYWSWDMRDAVDRYVEAGGNVARFAGNFAWQIRLEDDGNTQVCYKAMAGTHDPLRDSDQAHLLTSFWEDPAVGRSAVDTFGLNALYGIYAGVGVQVPRGTGGFTVYQPDHWAFTGSDLYYGDTIGGKAIIFGYEVDGLDYTFRDGLPYPTQRNNAPESLEILAMGLAANVERDHGHRGTVFYYGDSTPGLEEIRPGAARGNGMIVTFKRGNGTVFHAGSCEWVAGLKRRDQATETVTRNVLNRFTGQL